MSDQSQSPVSEMTPPHKVGALLLVLAAGIWIGFGLEKFDALPSVLYPLWSTQRWWLFLAGFGLPVVGVRLLQTRPAHWRPGVGGRRFHRVRLYSREQCHLCDVALGILQEHAQWLGPIEVVDIDSNSDWKTEYGNSIPVVECDGRWRFKGRVPLVLLRRLIECTPPLARITSE